MRRTACLLGALACACSVLGAAVQEIAVKIDRLEVLASQGGKQLIFVEFPYSGNTTRIKFNGQEECATSPCGTVPLQTKINALYGAGFRIIFVQNANSNPPTDPGGHNCTVGNSCIFKGCVEESSTYHMELCDLATWSAATFSNFRGAQNSIDHGHTSGAFVTLGHPEWSLRGIPFNVEACIQDDGGVFTDDTTDCNSAAANDVAFVPAVPVVGDAFLIGGVRDFGTVEVTVGTAGVGAYDLTWKYWNGAWVNLLNVIDDTNDFKTAGLQEVIFSVPSDWATTTINGQGPFYYVKAEVTTGGFTTNPLGTLLDIGTAPISSATGLSGLDSLEIYNDIVGLPQEESLEIAAAYLDRAYVENMRRPVLTASADGQCGGDGLCSQSDRNANFLYMPVSNPTWADAKRTILAGDFVASHVTAATTAGDFLIPLDPPALSGVTISFKTQSLGAGSANADCTWYGFGGKALETDTDVSGTVAASYTIKGGEGYVFARCTRDSATEDLFWTQPAFVRQMPFNASQFETIKNNFYDPDNLFLPSTIRAQQGTLIRTTGATPGGRRMPEILVDRDLTSGEVFEPWIELHAGGTADRKQQTHATRINAAKVVLDRDGTLFLRSHAIGHGGTIGSGFYGTGTALVIPDADDICSGFGGGTSTTQDCFDHSVDTWRFQDNGAIYFRLLAAGVPEASTQLSRTAAQNVRFMNIPVGTAAPALANGDLWANVDNFTTPTTIGFFARVNGVTVRTPAGDTAGVATSATALAANGGNCTTGSGAGGVDAAGVAEDCTNYAEAADTMTFTGKTLDVEGTGNAITTVSKIYLLAATCQNATATANFDTPTANAPAAACVTGTNTQKAYLDFDQTTDESVQGSLMLPTDWTGAIDVTYKWLTTATTGSATWCTQLICVADAETGDPAFPAQASGLCVSDAAKGTTLQYNDASDTGITATGCAAGELMYYRISRDPDQTSTLTDDLAADARLVGAELTLRRAQ